MKLFYSLIFLLLATWLKAQHIEQYYNWQWKRTEPVNARFLRVLDKKDSLWERKDYFFIEKSQKMSGMYTDTSYQTPQGVFNFYHPNRMPEATGEYVNGKKQGLWLSYFSNGSIHDSAVFDAGNIVGTSLKWHQNGFMADSSVYNTDGSGVTITWFDNGAVSSAGRYSAGYKKTGKWQFFNKNGKLASFEIYENDKPVSREYFDEHGVSMGTDIGNVDRDATFPGGNEAWQKFLSKQLYFPHQYRFENADNAVVVANAVIDEDGNVTNVEVSVPLHRDFDKIAMDALRNSPKWEPAIQHNRKVKYTIRQVVYFGHE